MPKVQNPNVLVVGTGTIGEPLTGLLCDHRKEFGINEVIFHKRTPLKTDRSKVLDLIERRGAKLAVDEDRVDAFRDFAMKPTYVRDEALEKAAVVIDCTPWSPVSPRPRHKSKNPSIFSLTPPIACTSPCWLTEPVTASDCRIGTSASADNSA